MLMLDDFIPIVHQLDGRTIKVWAIADVHLGSPSADVDGLQKFLDGLTEDDYLVIAGDFLNNAVKSSVSNVYLETMPPSAQVEYASKMLEPVADKILACVGGNHERRSKKEVDLDPLYQVMCIIRKPEIYRPNMAFVRVNLTRGNTKDHYALMVTHGKSLNKRKNFVSIVEGVDAVITAHTHTPDVMFAPSRIRFNESNKISFHNVISLCACSWLKAGGYSLSGLLTPQITSRPQCLELEFTGSNSRRGQIRIAW